MRRAAGLAAIVWLCAHVAMLSVSVVVLASQAADDAVACTCAHGNGVMCPMHHRRTEWPSPTHCAVQDASTSPALVATAWIGITGVLHDVVVAIGPARIQAVPRAARLTLARSSSRPESPPPRIHAA